MKISKLFIIALILVVGIVCYVVLTRLPAGEEVVLWAGLEHDEIKALEEIGKSFEDETGIRVKIVWESDIKRLRSKYRVAVPIGKGPDVLLGPHDWIGEFTRSGFITPIPENIFTSEIRAGFLDQALDAVTFEGKVWGIPTLLEAIVLIHNKDTFPQPPETWENLIMLAKPMAGPVWGFYYAHVDPYYSFPLQSGYGGYVFGEGENVENIGLATPGAVEGARFLQSMVIPRENGILPMDPMLDPYVVRDFFVAGKAKMIIDGPWAFGRFKKAGIDFGAARLPKLPNGQDPCTFVGVQTCMVNSRSDNIDAAMRFAMYLNSAESQLRLHQAGWRIPTLKNVLAQPEISEKPEVTVVLEQAGGGVLMPKAPEMEVVWTPWVNALKQIISGQDPQTMLETAVSEIRNEIERMK